jgi:NAD(P)-dependent dehydrogenase (short-subunit alcohol dehydrogenase family)
MAAQETRSGADGPNAVGHKNPVTAILTGLSDMLSNEGKLPPLGDDVRLDGKVVFVTGANSGLGKAVAIDCARRGAKVLMACRGGHPEAGEDVKRASGSDAVEMLKVDLSDLTSVHALCDEMKSRGERVDRVILNAGLMPASSRRSAQGFELMMSVHFLANRVLVDRFIQDGVVVPSADPAERPRIVFVASEAHKSAEPIDFDRLGEFVEYGVRDGMKEYGRTKLMTVTYAQELSRRLNPDWEEHGELGVAVHSLCPGPVASNIARDAPGWLQPILPPLLKLLFRSPEKAAEPVVLLAAAPEYGEETGVYLHMMRVKQPSQLAIDEVNGERIWEASDKLLAPHSAVSPAGAPRS